MESKNKKTMAFNELDTQFYETMLSSVMTPTQQIALSMGTTACDMVESALDSSF